MVNNVPSISVRMLLTSVLNKFLVIVFAFKYKQCLVMYPNWFRRPSQKVNMFNTHILSKSSQSHRGLGFMIAFCTRYGVVWRKGDLCSLANGFGIFKRQRKKYCRYIWKCWWIDIKFNNVYSFVLSIRKSQPKMLCYKQMPYTTIKKFLRYLNDGHLK